MGTNLNNFGYQTLRNNAEGVIAEVGSRLNVTGGDGPVDGGVYCSLIPLLQGNLVTSICVANFSGGTGVTRVELALLDSTGTRLGTTGDIKASFTAAGLVTGNLVSPVVVAADGYYYCAILVKTTISTITIGCLADIGLSVSAPDVLFGPLGAGARLAGQMNGQTTIPASVTIGAMVDIGAPWFGVV